MTGERKTNFDRYIELVREKRVDPRPLDSAFAKTLRRLFPNLPPIALLSTTRQSILMGALFGILFYPPWFLIMRLVFGAAVRFDLHFYCAIMFASPFVFGLPVAFVSKRYVKKHSLPSWSEFLQTSPNLPRLTK